jgi:hypothetical protein
MRKTIFCSSTCLVTSALASFIRARRGVTAPIFAKGCRKAGALDSNPSQEHLSGDQIRLSIGSDIDHEVEQHEAAEQEEHRRPCVRATSFSVY